MAKKNDKTQTTYRFGNSYVIGVKAPQHEHRKLIDRFDSLKNVAFTDDLLPACPLVTITKTLATDDGVLIELTPLFPVTITPELTRSSLTKLTHDA